MLARTTAELAAPTWPTTCWPRTARSLVEDIHLVARRGPAQAQFTTRELRELGDLSEADVVVDPADLELDDVSRAELVDSAAARRNLDVLAGWAQRAPGGTAAPGAPALLQPAGRVAGRGAGRPRIALERTRFGADGTLDRHR